VSSSDWKPGSSIANAHALTILARSSPHCALVIQQSKLQIFAFVLIVSVCGCQSTSMWLNPVYDSTSSESVGVLNFLTCRIYSDGMTAQYKQSLISWVVAVITLTSYTGIVHILLGLIIGSFFSRVCLCILLGLLATTWLPAKPLLWVAFCRYQISSHSCRHHSVQSSVINSATCFSAVLITFGCLHITPQRTLRMLHSSR
jgi:hypothetical protein